MCKCKNLSKISILFCYSYKFPIYAKIPFMNVSFAKASSSFDLLISISVIISCFTQNISLTSIPYPSLLLLILILGISKISMQSSKVISPLILAAVLLTKSENLLTTPACLKSCFVSFFPVELIRLKISLIVSVSSKSVVVVGNSYSQNCIQKSKSKTG